MNSKIFSKLFIFSFLLCSFSLFSQDEEILDNKENPCAYSLEGKSLKKFEKAQEAFDKKRYTEATPLLSELVQDHPDFVEPYFMLGMMAAKRENIASMTKNFEQVEKLCPDYANPYLYYYLGLLAYTDENFEKAATYFKKFFNILEDQPDAPVQDVYEEAKNYLQWSDFLAYSYKNAVPFDPQPVKGISTPANESIPYFSVDGSMVFFKRTIREKDGRSLFEGEEKEIVRMCMAERQSDGIFEQGFPLESPFNKSELEGYVSMTADNKMLFYTVCGVDKDFFMNCDIVYSEFKDGFWQPFKSVGSNVNTPQSMEMHPSVTPDGKWLYFVSDRRGGMGGTDIWRCKRLPGGDWGRAENLGTKVNSKGNEETPFMHPDGVTLYFSTNGRQGLGGFDIFYVRMDDESQTVPINIGMPINTENDEKNFSVSTSGRKAFFSSDQYKTTSDYDIFDFDLYERARPYHVVVIKGTLKDELDQNTAGNIVFLGKNTEENIEFPVDKEDGHFTAAVRSDLDYVMIAKKEGYAYDTRYLVSKKLQNDTLRINMQVRPIEVGQSYQLNDINFETGSAALTPEAEFVVNSFVDFLRENPTLYVVIQGHTDNVGDAKENMKLSNERAKAVYDYLLSRRIRQERIEYKGYGSEKPLAGNDTEEGRAKNRRTVFVITRK